jgi:DNA-binding transcriptional MerR regulator
MDRPESRMTRAVYVISVAAELAGVHPQTLRIYERKGLLDPARTIGGSRRYSERDIDQLRRIQDLTTAGLNLEGVRRVLELASRGGRPARRVGPGPPPSCGGGRAHAPAVPPGPGSGEKFPGPLAARPAACRREIGGRGCGHFIPNSRCRCAVATDPISEPIRTASS